MTALRTSVFRQNQLAHRYDDGRNDWDEESDGCSNDRIKRTVQLLRMIVSAMLMTVLLNLFLNIVIVVVVVVAVACCGSCCCYCSCSCSAIALAAAATAAAFWSVAIDVVKVGLVPCRIVQSKVVFIVW